MTKQRKHSRAERGESLVETLVATLVITLASVLLLSSSMSANRINQRNMDMGERYRENLAVAEKGAQHAAGKKEGEISLKFPSSRAFTYEVLFSGPDGEMRSYDKKPEAGGP